MSKLRILVGAERQLRIVKLISTTIVDANMVIKTNGGTFYRSIGYFPSDKHGWEVLDEPINPKFVPQIHFDWSVAKQMPAGPPTLRLNKKTWLTTPQPNFAIMDARKATVMCAAWNHVNYRCAFPHEYEVAVEGGIVFG